MIVTGCQDESVKQVLGLSGLSLRDALDAIVRAAPLYRWQLNDGVVNLLPSSGVPALLNIGIAEFDFSGDNVNLREHRLRMTAQP